MRISSDRHDPGYRELCAARARGERPVVTLNGEELRFVTLADDALGLVEYFVLDGEGRVQLDPADKSRVLSARAAGDVAISFVRRNADAETHSARPR